MEKVTEIYSIYDYFEEKINSISENTYAIMIFGPSSIINLNNSYVDFRGTTWSIIEYNGDDLKLRKELSERNPNNKYILFISPPNLHSYLLLSKVSRHRQVVIQYHQHL